MIVANFNRYELYMRKIDLLLEEYGESHQNPTNKTIHWVCVPLIFFSLVGLIFSIPSDVVQRFLGAGNPYANWATVLLILVTIYYVSLSIPLSLGMHRFGLCVSAFLYWRGSVSFMDIRWRGRNRPFLKIFSSC